MNIFRRLGIGRDADETAIKRAYSSKIKQYRPDTHPAEFAQIREAYEEALRQWRERGQWEQEDEDVSADAEGGTAATVPDVQPGEAPASEEGQQATMVSAADSPADIVATMLAQLESQSSQDTEEGALQRYRAQAVALAELPLDQQMDYEQALCSWLLFSDSPPLLVFQEASNRYGWEANSMEIVRTYGDYAGARFAATRKLAELFAAARASVNPFLIVDGKAGAPPPRVAKYYSASQAREQSATWKRECEKADFPQLMPRLGCAPAPPWQLFWVDFAVGLLAAGYSWLFMNFNGSWYLWPATCLIGVMATFLPAVARNAAILAKWKFRRVIEWYKNWRGPTPLGAGSKLFILPGILGGIWTIGFLGSLHELSSVWIYILAAVAGFILAWQVYKVLARLEAGVVSTSIRFARFVGWLRTAHKVQGQPGQQTSEWVRAKARWMARIKGHWQKARRSVFWWVFIWWALIQIMSKLAKT